MKPRETMYRLATVPSDYRRCHELLRRHPLEPGEEIPKFVWPTVLAERGGKLLGFLSTVPNPQRLIAGPLITNGGRWPGLTALRLIEAYEVVLRMAGVQFYYFHVSKSERFASWRGMIERVGIHPEWMDETRLWYLRRL